jgi:hypothetical protein
MKASPKNAIQASTGRSSVKFMKFKACLSDVENCVATLPTAFTLPRLNS